MPSKDVQEILRNASVIADELSKQPRDKVLQEFAGMMGVRQFPHYRLLTLSDDALYVTVSGATSFMLTTHKKDQISVFSDPAFVNVTRSRIAPAIAVEMLQEIEHRIHSQKGGAS